MLPHLPVSKPLPKFSGYNLDIKIRETKKRYNDWGHSLRDLGIKEAKGEYIIHLNPDNILYTDTLQEIAKIDSDIIICPIILEGTIRRVSGLTRTKREGDQVILDGFPPVHQNIDAMQLVMKTSLWRKYGGWYNKSEQSDGIMYQRFCSENDATYCGHIIGVHR